MALVSKAASARTRFFFPLHAAVLYAGTGKANPVLNRHSVLAQCNEQFWCDRRARVTVGHLPHGNHTQEH